MDVRFQILVCPARLIPVAVRSYLVYFAFNMMVGSQQIAAAAGQHQYNFIYSGLQISGNISFIRFPQEGSYLGPVNEQLGYNRIRCRVKLKGPLSSGCFFSPSSNV